jgi:hypothetical protein
MTPCSLVDGYECQMGHAISIFFHEDVDSKFLRNVGNQYNTWASASIPVTYGFLFFVSGFPQLKSSFSTSGSCMTGKHGTQLPVIALYVPYPGFDVSFLKQGVLKVCVLRTVAGPYEAVQRQQEPQYS